MTTTPTSGAADLPEALEDFELRKMAAIGPVHESNGLVERRPIVYRRELEDQFVRGFRAAESRRVAALAAGQAVAQDDLITIRKPTTSAEMLWLLKLAHLVMTDVDKTLEESFATAQPAAQQPAPSPAPASPLQWTPGPNAFKDWCSQWFGPDSDDTYLANAVHALPAMAQRFAQPAPTSQADTQPAPQQEAQEHSSDWNHSPCRWCGKTEAEHFMGWCSAMTSAGRYRPQPAPRQDPTLHDLKAALAVFNTTRAGSDKPSGYLRGIRAVIVHWESRPEPHRWMVPARADSVLEDAARLDWLDQQFEGYGFQDIHEGNRWEISGPYANVRQAIDAARAAQKEGRA